MIDENKDETQAPEMEAIPSMPSPLDQPQLDPNHPRIMLKGLEGLTLEGLQVFKKRIVEDNRMDSIFRSKQNLQEKFDNRAYLHPHGMTEFDYKSIPEKRRPGLEKFKHKTRHENWKYLGEHYDLDSMLGLFFKKLLSVKPQDAVLFAAEYFTSDILQPGYESLLEIEQRKISNYRVAKMKEAEKITTIIMHDWGDKDKEEKKYERCFRKTKPKCPPKPGEDQLSKEIREKPRDDNLNWLKKLNIGPLAQDFDTRVILPPPEPVPVVEEIKEPEKKPVKKFYCGCKDPGRREINFPPPKPEPPPHEDDDDDYDSDDDSDDHHDLKAGGSMASVASAPSVPRFAGLRGSTFHPKGKAPFGQQSIGPVTRDE